MMTLWCMMRSPLMIGGELNKCDDFTLSLLTNAPLLEITKAGFCAHPLTTTDEESVWISPRQDGRGLYAALFNLSDKKRTVRVDPALLGAAGAQAEELWTGKKVRVRDLHAVLPPHDAAVFYMEFANS